MKKFLIIGNGNAITYKEIFPLIKENKMWFGQNTKCGTRKGNSLVFTTPNGGTKKFGNICWYTNLNHPKRNEEIYLYKTYNETDYPKYDNYDAINVDRVADIPINYFGEMGVPITFINKLNRNQFEITGITTSFDKGQTSIFGKIKYARLLIRRKF